jgi:hypothetical protein
VRCLSCRTLRSGYSRTSNLFTSSNVRERAGQTKERNGQYAIADEGRRGAKAERATRPLTSR